MGIGERLRQAGRLLAAAVYPPRCLGCDDYMPLEQATAREKASPTSRSSEVAWWFCPSCLSGLHDLEGACVRCGAPASGFIDVAQGGRCAACVRLPVPWRQAICLFEHDGVAQRAVVRAKKRQGQGVAGGLGALLASEVGRRLEQGTERPGWLVVPVPLHADRELERGFNQAAVVARELHVRLGLELDEGALRRPVVGQAQHALDRAGRLVALQGAYVAVGQRVEGRQILLVDDVLTTGATLLACAEAIVGAGGVVDAVATVTRTR